MPASPATNDCSRPPPGGCRGIDFAWPIIVSGNDYCIIITDSASPAQSRPAFDVLARIHMPIAHIGDRSFNCTSKTTREQLDPIDALVMDAIPLRVPHIRAA